MMCMCCSAVNYISNSFLMLMIHDFLVMNKSVSKMHLNYKGHVVGAVSGIERCGCII